MILRKGSFASSDMATFAVQTNLYNNEKIISFSTASFSGAEADVRQRVHKGTPAVP